MNIFKENHQPLPKQRLPAISEITLREKELFAFAWSTQRQGIIIDCLCLISLYLYEKRISCLYT